MSIPKYTITHKILTLITKIEANRSYLQSIEIPEKIVLNLTHESLLKSSVFSARIEGNSLTTDDMANKTVEEEKQYELMEINNIIKALSYIRERNIPETIDLNYILNLHKIVMNKLIHTTQTGKFRTEPSAIFDRDGQVVYMTPPPSEIDGLIVELLFLINNTNDIFPLIKAPLVHMTFEKIHPFLDGNGRVGRLLFQAILAKNNYHFNWLISIEELVNSKKETYYALLALPEATELIEYILDLIFMESEKLKLKIGNTNNFTDEDFLFPRRREILEIVRDKRMVSLDTIHRRFLKVSPRTLRYDLMQLEKSGFIKKIGTTRGVLYAPVKK